MNEVQSCSNCECTNWEQVDIEARTLRDRELQERVQRPERNRSRAIGDPIYIDNPYSPRISEEQLARARDLASGLVDRVNSWQGFDRGSEEGDRTGYQVRLRQEEERIFRDRYENQYEARPLPRTEVPRRPYPTITAAQLQEIVRQLPDPERAAIDRVRTYCCDRYFHSGLEDDFNARIERERLVFELKQICYRTHCFHRWVYRGEVIME